MTDEEVEAEVLRDLENSRSADYLAKIDPYKLEHLCAKLFGKMGYDVRLTTPGPDNGADGFLWEGSDLRYVFQCKRYQGKVGEPIVRDLYGTQLHFGAEKALIIATGGLTRQAERWIRGKPIDYLGVEKLAQLSKQFLNEADFPNARFRLQAKRNLEKARGSIEKALLEERSRNQCRKLRLARMRQSEDAEM